LKPLNTINADEYCNIVVVDKCNQCCASFEEGYAKAKEEMGQREKDLEESERVLKRLGLFFRHLSEDYKNALLAKVLKYEDK